MPVSDQDRAYAFYVDTLGFEVRADIPYGEGSEDRWLEVAAPGSPTPLAIVPPAPGGPIGVDTNIILTTGQEHAPARGGLGRAVSRVVWYVTMSLYVASEDRGEVELERVDLAESGRQTSLRFRVKR